jgi:hypothetical protein
MTQIKRQKAKCNNQKSGAAQPLIPFAFPFLPFDLT